MATHKVTVEGIGDFVFRRATMADSIGIDAEASRILGGECYHPLVVRNALALARIGKLGEEFPKGFVLGDLDPTAEGDMEKLLKVYGALRAAEDSFRPSGKAGSAAAGPGAEPDDRVPLAAAV